LRKSVVVFDYGSGNVHSALKAVEKVGADAALTQISIWLLVPMGF